MSQIDPLSGIRFAYDINSFYLVCPLNFIVRVYYSVRGNARPPKIIELLLVSTKFW